MIYTRTLTPEARPGLRAMESDAADKLAGRERHTSEELEVLNNQGELALFGDGGDNGQPDYEVKTLEVHGDHQHVKTEYKFKDTDPQRGLLHDVKSNPAFGKTQSERDKSVQKFQDEVQRLKDNGLEMAQIASIMAMRVREASAVGHQIGQRVTRGENPTTARRNVLDQYYGESTGASYGSMSYIFASDDGFYTRPGSRGEDIRKKSKDLMRIEKMKKHGLMTVDEYDSFVPGTGDPGAPDPADPTPPAPEPSTLDKMEAVTFTPDQQDKINDANANAKKAREAYEDIMIHRESHTFTFKKQYRKKALQEAYEQWMEAEQLAGAAVAEAYKDHGFKLDTDARGGNPDRADMKELKALGALNKIDRHNESIKQKIENSVDELGPITRKVAELYANFGAVKPGRDPSESEGWKAKLGRYTKKTVKAVGLIGAGSLVAIPAVAVVGGVLGAGVAGGFTGLGVSRVARGGLIAKIKKVSNARLGITVADENRLAARDVINRNKMASDVLDPSLETGANVYRDNSDEVVKRNRRRTIGGAILGATGATLVTEYGDIWDGVKNSADWAWDKVPIVGGDGDAGGMGDGNGGSGAAESPDPGPRGPGGVVVDPGDADGVGPGAGTLDPGDSTLGGGEASEVGQDIFNVESGNGFTHEIQDLSQEIGMEVDSETAYRIYLEAFNRFGADLTTGGEYPMGGSNYGIDSAGVRAWNPGVRDFLVDQIQQANRS